MQYFAEIPKWRIENNGRLLHYIQAIATDTEKTSILILYQSLIATSQIVNCRHFWLPVVEAI